MLYSNIFFPCWILFSYIIGKMYLSMLMAVILVPHVEDPIDTIDDVIRHNVKFFFRTGASQIVLVKEKYPEISDNIVEVPAVTAEMLLQQNGVQVDGATLDIGELPLIASINTLQAMFYFRQVSPKEQVSCWKTGLGA